MNSSMVPHKAADEPVEFSLAYRSWDRRTLGNTLMNWLSGALAVVACLPLFSLLGMVFYRGFKSLSWETLVSLPPAPLEPGGGFGNAIVGTFTVVTLAALISVPCGIMTAIYIAYLGPESRVAEAVRFVARVLSGLPSILAGVFAYALVVLTMKSYSAIAGAIALAVLMLPVVLLTAEQSLRMVQSKIIEAAVGMGCNQTQVVWRVLLPTAFPGILTGVLLAVARAAGETAPLLFTALFSNYWLLQDGRLTLDEPTASLAVFIFNFSGSAYDNMIEMAWAAALVLVLMILVINLLAQFITQRPHGR
jgi:phosphate transport system permease protein